MRLDLLPHEAIPVVFWEPGRYSGRCSTANVDDGELWRRRGGALWVVLSIRLSTLHVCYLRASRHHLLNYP